MGTKIQQEIQHCGHRQINQYNKLRNTLNDIIGGGEAQTMMKGTPCPTIAETDLRAKPTKSHDSIGLASSLLTPL